MRLIDDIMMMIFPVLTLTFCTFLFCFCIDNRRLIDTINQRLEREQKIECQCPRYQSSPTDPHWIIDTREKR